MTFEGVQLQGTVKIMEKLNVRYKITRFMSIRMLINFY